MKSMTGYGQGAAHDERIEVTCELNSVNRKALEIGIHLPKEWSGFESWIHDEIRKELQRGKVNGSVQVQFQPGSEAAFWDEEAVLNVWKGLQDLALKAGVQWEPTPELLARIALSNGNKTAAIPQDEQALALLQQAVQGALKQLCEMRSREGDRLKTDILQRLESLQQWKEQIRNLAADTTVHYRQLLFSRLEQAGLELELDDERVLKELALFADKVDVSEELTRLESHIEQFGNFAEQPEAVGRRMDFLCQELFREINTVGSKANHVEVTRIVIDFKNELERIREQVQNLE